VFKLDGEVKEAFYRKHMKEWREDQKRLQRHIEAHQEADENYIGQGIRLIEIFRNGHAFYQSKDQPIRAELVQLIKNRQQANLLSVLSPSPNCDIDMNFNPYIFLLTKEL
jgi:hypothetical protein